MRPPTEKQFRKLLMLAGGSIALAPRRGEWNPLLRRGWVEAVTADEGHRRFLPPLRLTIAGYRAIADYYERAGGLPEIKPGEFKHAEEAPRVVRLREERDRAREQAREADRLRWRAENKLLRVQRLVEELTALGNKHDTGDDA